MASWKGFGLVKEAISALKFLRSYFPSFSLFRASLAGDEIGA
jgi:hypothetical protein